MNDTNTKGELVAFVSQGSPADLAGIKEGTAENNLDLGNNNYVNSDSDIIVGIDAKPISKIEDILNYINSKSIGDTITLKILRNGVIQNTSLTLTERP